MVRACASRLTGSPASNTSRSLVSFTGVNAGSRTSQRMALCQNVSYARAPCPAPAATRLQYQVESLVSAIERPRPNCPTARTGAPPCAGSSRSTCAPALAPAVRLCPGSFGSADQTPAFAVADGTSRVSGWRAPASVRRGATSSAVEPGAAVGRSVTGRISSMGVPP